MPRWSQHWPCASASGAARPRSPTLGRVWMEWVAEALTRFAERVSSRSPWRVLRPRTARAAPASSPIRANPTKKPRAVTSLDPPWQARGAGTELFKRHQPHRARYSTPRVLAWRREPTPHASHASRRSFAAIAPTDDDSAARVDLGQNVRTLPRRLPPCGFPPPMDCYKTISGWGAGKLFVREQQPCCRRHQQ